MAAGKCKCGRWAEGLSCLYCQSDIGWEAVYPLPVDVYIAEELGWVEPVVEGEDR